MAASTTISHGDLNPPLPDFVFPARGPTSSSTSAPSSFSKASGRRPLSSFEGGIHGSMAERMDARRSSTPAVLPVFSFNPAAPIDTDSNLPTSPSSLSPRSIPSRPNSLHKRGTSEFIGGSGTNLISSSPTKTEVAPSTPTFGPPPPNRRGHAHRRSTAMSSVSDLSFILKPSDPNATRGGSAPCSPNRDEPQISPFSFPMSKDSAATDSETSPPSKPSRARVGFSDTVQFIPRPLSLVSSEGSGTTIRAGGHSVSGSLSSIISAPSPPAKEKQPCLVTTDTRPKTAAARLDGNGPISPTLERPVPRRHRSNPLLTDNIDVAPTSPSTPKFASKKWSLFGPGDASPQSRPTSSTSLNEPQQVVLASPPSVMSPSDVPIPSTEQSSSRRSSISRKPSSLKKQKKVKSWAGSILSRKTRQRAQKQQSRRSPTPPHRSYASSNNNVNFELSQPEPDIPEVVPTQLPTLNTNISSWVPRRVQTLDDDSSMSPMIDLDAALGPFNTPTGRDAEWDSVTGSKPPKKGKRMHSAAGMGNFGGPGMHYHRRAASSPELENPRFGIRHPNSSSTMADVFEEDEEDAWEDAKTSDKDFSGKTDDEDESGIDTNVVEAENTNGERSMDWMLDNSMRGIKRKGSGLSEGDRRHLSSSMKSTCSSSSLRDETVLEESTGTVEIFDDSVSQRPESRAQSSDSTATPPLRARQPPKDLAPVSIQTFSLQSPYLIPTSPSTAHSSLPSPRSPFSYDTQRISSAPSSFNDEGGFQSLLMGEPGPELRLSVDDVPSLISSNSAMTRDGGVNPVAHNPQFREGQRSASFSAAATRKRSSMASLSRLISSSHGEKSKLSMELRPPSPMGEKKDKESKGKRLSRMMQFWKPKDTT